MAASINNPLSTAQVKTPSYAFDEPGYLHQTASRSQPLHSVLKKAPKVSNHRSLELIVVWASCRSGATDQLFR